jgi:hypothetical protein
MPLGQPFLHLMVEIDGGASANSVLLNSCCGGGFMVHLHSSKGQHEMGLRETERERERERLIAGLLM